MVKSAGVKGLTEHMATLRRLFEILSIRFSLQPTEVSPSLYSQGRAMCVSPCPQSMGGIIDSAG